MEFDPEFEKNDEEYIFNQLQQALGFSDLSDYKEPIFAHISHNVAKRKVQVIILHNNIIT